jgi:putative DNA primase/helicase
MRREFFEFRPAFLLLLATNFKPSFKGQDEGLWRRVKLIPWERYFAPEERDHRLGDALLAESQGIFAWAVRGAKEWFANGLQDPSTIRNSTKAYRETSDVLNGFFPGVYVADEGGRVVQSQLFRDFQEWSDTNNYLDLKRWSSRAFYAALEERGLVRKKSHGAQCFYGIRRARHADSIEGHEEPEEEPRAGGPISAYSSPDTETPTSGPSLDDVL